MQHLLADVNNVRAQYNEVRSSSGERPNGTPAAALLR